MNHKTKNTGTPLVSLLTLLLVAINLRPAITAIGPVMPMIGADLGLGPSSLGILGALPLACFGLVSFAVQPLMARFGVERTTAGALAVLTVATVWRSWPGPEANLWLGTVLVGSSIAVGNVTVPVLVKQRFPKSTALITSIYVAVLGLFAGLAAALAVPLADGSPLGWRLSLGAWALLTLVATAFWLHRAHHTARPPTGRTAPGPAAAAAAAPIWRSRLAWQLSLYMGLQSSVFYVALTWLPSVEQALSVALATAGWHMLLLQVAGTVGNLVAPVLMRAGGDQRLAATLPGAAALLAVGGIYLAPAWVGLWVLVLGLATGTTFVVALSLMALRAGDLAAAGKLSAMSQSVGYGLAALILWGAGALQALGPLGPLAVLALTSVGVILSGLPVGRGKALAPAPDRSQG
ncbi:MAG TPA: MFS transporter [Ottowia sp.]|uniref:MFS transporter n=1 Tax=Ottowia sp. TaxID=1898956 RepID=UPI002C1C7FFC|nr:MFS transporter [Ottowia sp.]HMN20844.1 MFS transporter [Ottowia sp.]